jgi:chemotaxis protein MotB
MSTFSEIKVHKKAKEKEPIWLIAYVDLTTNLMALFILMLAMSKVDTQKFDAVSKEVSNQRTDSLSELLEKINAEIKAKKLEKSVTTSLGAAGLQVEFLNGVLYESASSDLSSFAKNEAKPILDILSRTDAKYLLSFDGHTDDVPIKKSIKFRDNWDLSTQRGVSLLDVMKKLGVPEARMSVAGFSDTKPKIPIQGKTGKELENARASNRRVVIRVFQ